MENGTYGYFFIHLIPTLVLKRLLENEQVDKVPLNHVSFWVQIPNLPFGFWSSKIVKRYWRL